jgi:hypothetical protein
LEGKLIAYHDDQYEVTTGPHEILMKLMQDTDEMTIFYVHVPYAYPIPDGIKNNVKSDLEAELNRSIPKMTFINVGTEAQKKDLQFRVELGGDLDG